MSGIARKITKFKKKEIDYLFKHARRVFKNPSFLILMSPRQTDFARILIVASSKVAHAVGRNKIRRRIRSIFYEERFFDGLYDWVVIVYPKAIALEFDGIKKIFLGVFTKECNHENAALQ